MSLDGEVGLRFTRRSDFMDLQEDQILVLHVRSHWESLGKHL